jgi:hypothetical protein
MGELMNQDAKEEKDSAKKSHHPMSGPTQPRIVVREVTASQAPSDQAEDDEPGIIQRNLYP